MASMPSGWERLRPSIGKTGNAGRRLLSQDNEVQVQMLRQTHGPHAGWRWLWEWIEERDSWEFLLRDEHSNVVAQGFGHTVAEAREAANDILAGKGYELLPE
jgi:hypothetical protein